MKLVIAVNSNGTHTFSSYEHEADWNNPEYRKAWDYACEKTFRKLRKDNRYPITITEFDDEQSPRDTNRSTEKTGQDNKAVERDS